MSIQLIQEIQQKVPFGTQVTFTLKTEEKVSGLLVGIGLDGITLSMASEEVKKISVDDILTFNMQILENNIEESSLDANKGGTPDTSDPVNFKKRASKQLAEIEKRFNIKIQTVNLELDPPDLKFPAAELPGWENTTVVGTTIVGIWLGIKRQYEDVQKANELSSNDDTIQQIVHKLKSLVKMYPNSLTLKRVLGYFYSILDNWDETLHNYQDAVAQSEKVDDYDWFNIAVSALKLKKEELACYSLGRFFSEVTPVAKPQAWNVYVSLIEKFNNLSAFCELCKSDQHVIKEEETQVLLEAAIHLLKKNDEALASEIMQKWLTGESENSLLTEVCERLDGQPTKSYRQFLTQFMNTMIALEKKSNPITPERSKYTGGAKPPTSQLTQPKQKQQTPGASGRKGQYYNLYRQAEQANTRYKDLEKAERLYGECMKRGIEFESALKDRAMVLARLERYEEAEKLLLLKDNRQKVKDEQSVDRLLLNIYQKWGQYQKAINLLNDFLGQTQDIEKNTDIQWQIASTYFKLEDYVNAETKFRQVREQRPDNIILERNIAVCLSEQKLYDEAEEILNEIQKISPSLKTAELLEAIERAKTAAEFSLNVDNSKEFLSDYEDNSKEFLSDFAFSRDASEFAQFFLKRCDFEGVQSDRVIIDENGEKKYDLPSQRLALADMEQLAEAAENPRSAGPARPSQRAPLYHTLAKICDMASGDLGDRNDFYRYLCSCFVSRGDAAVTEDLNTAQAWYREALIAYDRIRLSNLAKDAEIDAKGSLVRFLYAIDGPSDKIPKPPNTPVIDQTVRDVIGTCQEKQKIFDAIVYLVSHSQYANDQILKVLYEDSTLQVQAIAYLKKMGISIPSTIDNQDIFSQLWNNLENKNVERVDEIKNDLGFLNDFELSPTSLENSIARAHELHSKLLFSLDQLRIMELQRLLRTASDLWEQTTFDSRHNTCNNLKGACGRLFEEIETKPTNLSVKYVYPTIETIQQKVNAYLEKLYEDSKPKVTVRLPVVESYPLPEKDQNIRVPIVVMNEEGQMPAENVNLFIESDSMIIDEKEVKNKNVLYGGRDAQWTQTVHPRLPELAVGEKAFSLRVRAEYDIPFPLGRGEKGKTDLFTFSIRFDSGKKFTPIYNPYLDYANGLEVQKDDMFFGRKPLINRITNAIQQSGSQNSKCVLVYGQYRSGKSSVRFHLKKSLEQDEDLLVADVGDLAFTSDVEKPVLNQILGFILDAIKKEIEKRGANNKKFASLDISILDPKNLDDQFNIITTFENIICELKQSFEEKNCGDIQIVLLIDEFQRIYDQIIANRLDAEFLKIWKRFLQQNLFSAVLVGQQVMAKFKDRFDINNVFAAMQHEKVTYLEEDEAKELIIKPILIQEGKYPYLERAVEQILKLTASSPYYIQNICAQLVELMNAVPTQWVTEADVQHVADTLIDNASEGFFQGFIDSGDKSGYRIADEDALKVLATIAKNSGSSDQWLRNEIDGKTDSSVDDILSDLVDRDVVKLNEQKYSIKAGLFKDWLIRKR